MATLELFAPEDFEIKVLANERPVLLDIGASWCPPCRIMDAAVGAIAAECDSRIAVFRVDAENDPALANRCGAGGRLPCFAVYRAGERLARRWGQCSREELMTWITGCLEGRILEQEAMPLMKAKKGDLYKTLDGHVAYIEAVSNSEKGQVIYARTMVAPSEHAWHIYINGRRAKFWGDTPENGTWQTYPDDGFNLVRDD